MLKVCGDLIDLDISILSIKIIKHVRNFSTMSTQIIIFEALKERQDKATDLSSP